MRHHPARSEAALGVSVPTLGEEVIVLRGTRHPLEMGRGPEEEIEHDSPPLSDGIDGPGGIALGFPDARSDGAASCRSKGSSGIPIESSPP